VNFLKFKSILAASLCLGPLLFSNYASADNKALQVMATHKDDAHQKALVAAAKKEGSVTFYTSITQQIAQKIITDFESKYGIKVKLWRSGDMNVLQRVISERNAGRPAVDVVNIGSIQMEMAHREKLLLSVKSPYANNMVNGAVGTNHEYVATFVDLELQAYNTKIVKKEDLPKTYQDLLDPKWKGKLGIEATDQEWFYNIMASMGEENGTKYFRELMATNKPSLRTGHSLLGNLVASGEVPIGLTVYNHTATTAKKIGAPVDYFIMEPAVAIGFSGGISNQSQNPHAALLFYQFLLTDAQQILADLDYIPTDKNIETPFKNVRYVLTDQKKFVDQFTKWTQLWQDLVIQPK
jgi:iron(III) transport system substrate-binding protein